MLMDNRTDKQIAEMASQFVASEFGQYYLTMLSTEYNGWHQEAEGDLSVEQKALKVERAAGLRFAIDWLTGKDKLVKSGYYDK